METTTLAINGGKPEISYAGPHWVWPPKSESQVEAVVKFLREQKYNKYGYLEIVRLFEQNFKKYTQAKYALTLNSGTSALQTAYYAIGLKPGDEVIVPSLTFHATATPLFQVGALPVLCDCDPEIFTIDHTKIESLVTSKTKAISVTHLWGHPCEMDEIIEIANKYDLLIVEDCSHAHGAYYKGKMVGTLGDIGCFSLDNKKIMPCGEGGMLVTNQKELFERSLLYSDFGPRSDNEITVKRYKNYTSTGLGNKFRINPMAAAIGNDLLKDLDSYIEMRRERLDFLTQGMTSIPGISGPVTRNYVTRGAFFGYKPSYHSEELGGLSLDDFVRALQAEGMDIRKTVSLPLHALGIFNDDLSDIIPTFGDDNYMQNILKRNVKPLNFRNTQSVLDSTFSLATFTLEDFDILEQYLCAFNKVCSYYAS